MKLKIEDINKYLVCKLCNGYFRDCHTIPECRDSFCKICLLESIYPEDKKPCLFCPTCNIPLGQKPLTKIVFDRNIQAIVDKLFPEFAAQEKIVSNENAARNESHRLDTEKLSEKCSLLEESLNATIEDSQDNSQSLLINPNTEEVQAKKKQKNNHDDMNDEMTAEIVTLKLHYLTMEPFEEPIEDAAKLLPVLAKPNFRVKTSVKLRVIAKEVLSRLKKIPNFCQEEIEIDLILGDNVLNCQHETLGDVLLGIPGLVEGKAILFKYRRR